jgi:hypothetical protein
MQNVPVKIINRSPRLERQCEIWAIPARLSEITAGGQCLAKELIE